MSLVDAGAITKRMMAFCDKNCPYTPKARDVMCGACFMGMAMELLEDAPTIEPERKTGEWLPDNRPGGGFWVCSCCKFPSEAFAANVLYKFCPNCGAFMGGGEGV